jgi:carbamoyl-phosphate synthase large subunit
LVENNDEAIFLMKKFPRSIFQELLEPENKEVTCAVYRKKDGEVAVLQLLRKLTGGLTGWAKVIYDHETSEMCKLIATGLDLSGSMNIQLRITDSGPRVFEINPRFSSTVLMRHRFGFSDLLWAIDEAEGKSIEFPNIKIGQCMVRVQDAKNLQ